MAEPEVLSAHNQEPQQKSAAIEKKELASDVLASIGAAQVAARYQMALKNPRDWMVVRQKILHACERPFFADAALYAKPMGGSRVTGLSIRFAEEAQRSMGNIMPERMVIFDDSEKRIVRMAITDIENNVTHYKDIILEKTVERKSKTGRKVISQRPNSSGEITYLVEATEDELLTKESAISSKIERQLTLKILPGDIQEEALSAIRETQRKRDKADPDAAKKKIIDAFDDMGVRVADLKEFLGSASLDNIQPKDLETLRGIWTAINEGETTWREVMEAQRTARGDKKPEGASAASTTTAAGKAGAAARKAADAAKSAHEPGAAGPQGQDAMKQGTTMEPSDSTSAKPQDSAKNSQPSLGDEPW